MAGSNPSAGTILPIVQQQQFAVDNQPVQQVALKLAIVMPGPQVRRGRGNALRDGYRRIQETSGSPTRTPPVMARL